MQKTNNVPDSDNVNTSNGWASKKDELTVLEQQAASEQYFDSVVGTTEQEIEQDDSTVSDSHDDRDEENDGQENDGESRFER